MSVAPFDDELGAYYPDTLHDGDEIEGDVGGDRSRRNHGHDRRRRGRRHRRRRIFRACLRQQRARHTREAPSRTRAGRRHRR